MAPPYSPMLDFSLLHKHADAGFTRWQWYEDQLGRPLPEILLVCALGFALVRVGAMHLTSRWSARGREVERLTEENGKQQELICELEARVTDLRAQIRYEAADGQFSTASTPSRNDPALPLDRLITTTAGLRFKPAAAGCAAAHTELEDHVDDRDSEPSSPPAMRITTPCHDLVPYDAVPWVGEATDNMLSLLEAANPSKRQQLILPLTKEEVESYTPHYTAYAVDSSLPTNIILDKCSKSPQECCTASRVQHTHQAITLRVEDRVFKAATGVPRGWTQKDRERSMQIAVVAPEKGESKSLGASVEEAGEQRWRSNNEEDSEEGEDFEDEESGDEEPWKIEV
ncbi:hypothetical protein B0A48_16650 [Cryoendolithus antarcticus]|uniref:Uncharacterized protein n=1 Tax=Cryoendolithus antarcticus TaxID=1507870 RepID=A0A1V8SEQ0_9PEZI|nr:hypothetical protein B0A48_16650 [Cryoendolithus antarcticus]